MIGFQPYETFQLLIETGGVDRANTLLVAACDAFSRRRMPPQAEIAQFEALANRLFPTAAPSARTKAAATLGRAEHLTPALEQLVIDNIGDDIGDYLISARHLSDEALLGVVSKGDIETCAAAARRGDLSNPVLTKLFQMNSRKVYRALASNTAITPTGPFLNALARSAQMDHQVAWSLAARPDFDAALLAPAFFDLREADRVNVIQAFAERNTPEAPIKKTLEQLSVANHELTRALMKLFTQNRRAEVTRLLSQVTGLDEVRCGQIAHDVSGAALFVVLRAFGCTAYDGLKVLIHATSHDEDRSKTLSDFAKLFQSVDVDAMTFLMSAWRGDVNLLDLAKPEYRPASTRRQPQQAPATSDRELPARQDSVVTQAIDALERIGVRRAS
ncbi:DUF2336 domain-containing protein [Mariluticola halotolerans]|uniref:DUF2336 domain-containing protein n=1 Tax=Mariluticola halotolerans TaxID=2909283 RepID=UPI0026E119B5|nr:DUF2336 domain-containing protein [Mariluticola halotolerans]UJQ95752.1 DUF2336 domain-containing protein [Mariluticola halotolerans]